MKSDVASFNPEHAVKHGINAAVVMDFVVNHCNNSHHSNGVEHTDGSIYFYLSGEIISASLPFLSKAQCNNALKTLNRVGLLKSVRPMPFPQLTKTFYSVAN